MSALRIVKFVLVFLLVPVLVSLAILAALWLIDVAAHDWLRQSSMGMFLEDQFLITYGALLFCTIGAWIWGPIFYALVRLMSSTHPLWIYAVIGAVTGFLPAASIALPFLLWGAEVDVELSGRLHAGGFLVQVTLLCMAYPLAMRFALGWMGLIGPAPLKPT